MSKNYNVTKGKKWKIGDVTIESIIEEEVTYNGALKDYMFPNAKFVKEEIEWMIPEHLTEDLGLNLVIQSYLIKYNGYNILVDTGKNEPGIYEENFHATGCSFEDIDYVICTHLHFDHVARNTKMGINGTLVPTFPNARYLFGRKEYEHYKELYENPEKRNIDPLAERQIWPYLIHMKSLVEMEKVDFIDDDFNLFDVIKVYPAFGHSAGQYALSIQSNGDSAFIGADIAHHPVQLTYPDLAVSFDVDSKLSSEVRRKVFSELAGTNTLYLGMHFGGNHGGFIVKDGDGFKLVDDFQEI